MFLISNFKLTSYLCGVSHQISYWSILVDDNCYSGMFCRYLLSVTFVEGNTHLGYFIISGASDGGVSVRLVVTREPEHRHAGNHKGTKAIRGADWKCNLRGKSVSGVCWVDGHNLWWEETLLTGLNILLLSTVASLLSVECVSKFFY